MACGLLPRVVAPTSTLISASPSTWGEIVSSSDEHLVLANPQNHGPMEMGWRLLAMGSRAFLPWMRSAATNPRCEPEPGLGVMIHAPSLSIFQARY